MVKHTQTIPWQIADEMFECDHFLGLALKGLKTVIHVFFASYMRPILSNIDLSVRNIRWKTFA